MNNMSMEASSSDSKEGEMQISRFNYLPEEKYPPTPNSARVHSWLPSSVGSNSPVFGLALISMWAKICSYLYFSKKA